MVIKKEEFEEYCIKNNLRYKFENKYYQEQLLKLNWNIEDLFIVLCCYGYIETIKWFVKLCNIDIHFRNEYAFRTSCQHGRMEIVNWLLEVSKENKEIINIHIENEYAFTNSCGNGYIEMAKFLIKISEENGKIIDIHANYEEAFRGTI
jgi:hypothetical protein